MGAFTNIQPADQDYYQRKFEQIVGKSGALKVVLEQVERVAPTHSTVLVQGETGTGKELIAHAIHNVSHRWGRPLIKLNCAAIPFDLLESELFGHEKGAFTGAIAQKVGRFELADKGTLFLDEIGDIPLALQPKLLRVLQEQEFERLGSSRTHKVDVRLIAATHRDLTEMVKRNEFRTDLYYRLNVFPILVPPLRERREDIVHLIGHYVDVYSRKMNKRIEHISPETLAALRSYHWPGNIRELQNLIERAVILSVDGVLPNPLPPASPPDIERQSPEQNTLRLEDFIERAVPLTRGRSLEAPLAELRKTSTGGSVHHDLPEVRPVARGSADSRSDKSSVADEYTRKQRDEIVRALSACKGRVGGADGAAARLGINRTTLLSRMKKLGIYPKQYA